MHRDFGGFLYRIRVTGNGLLAIPTTTYKGLCACDVYIIVLSR
jgi:hypothetical protein